MAALTAVERGGGCSGLSYEDIKQEVEWAVKDSHQWLTQGADCDGKQAEVEKVRVRYGMSNVSQNSKAL